MDINHVIEIGRLTRDAEVNYTPGGMAIAAFSIAVSRRVKKGNEWVDEASYFDVKVFGNQAKNLGQFLTKGKQVGIDGYLHQDRWEKDGQKFNRVLIHANNVELLGGRDGAPRNDYADDNAYGDGYGANG